MDTITLELAPQVKLTLAALNRAVLVNMYAQPSDIQPPDLPAGYTHEDALKIDDYRARFEAYQTRLSTDGSMRVLGAARLAAQDFVGGEAIATEQAAFVRFCKRYALGGFDQDDPLSTGYAIYAAAQISPDVKLDTVFDFLFKTLGVPSALVAEERKSANGNGSGQTAGSRGKRHKAQSESTAS